MDLYCQVCAEPWEHYYIHHEMDHEGPGDSKRFLSGVGCPSCRWGANRPAETPIRAMAAGALSELLGDDTDGIAAMMEDFDALGMLE